MALGTVAGRSPDRNASSLVERLGVGRTRSLPYRRAAHRTLPILLLAALSYGCGREAPSASGPYIGTTLSGPAPEFRLADQTGNVFALSNFQGQVVTLTFFDSQCKEVCPLTAAQLRTTYEDLGGDSASVAFMAVNVNLQAAEVADVAEATQKWRLDEVEGWHFFTGGSGELQAVHQAYHIAVYRPPGEATELWHTPGVFLIDRKGNLRWYVSTPFDEEGVARWTAPLSDLLGMHIRELLREGAG